MYIYALAATYFVACCYAMRMIEAGGDNMAMGCYGNQQQTTNQPQNRHFMHPKLMLVCMYVALFLGTWNESTLYWNAGIVVRILIIPSNKRASYGYKSQKVF